MAIPTPGCCDGPNELLAKILLGLQDISAGGGSGSITVSDEGLQITSGVTSFDFVGGGVSATAVGNAVTVTIGGGGGGLAATNFVYNEIPAGAADGVNTVFTLANIPVLDKQAVYLNGLHQNPGLANDYTIVADVITFNVAPVVGSNILVDYIKP